MEVERILQNTPSTLTVTFYADGVPADPDSQQATVTIESWDGTAIVEDASTTREDVGVFSYELDSQSDLDRLKETWKANFDSQPVEIVKYTEIVGGLFFTTVELQKYDTVIENNPTKYTQDDLLQARYDVECEFEDICNQAFVPRFHYETHVANGTSYRLFLEKMNPLEILSITVDGVDKMSLVTDGTIARDTESRRSLVRSDEEWDGTIVLSYVHGMYITPHRIKRAALRRARSFVLGENARIDERATSLHTESGTYRLETAGRWGSLVGVPAIDIVLKKYTIDDDEVGLY